MSAKINVWHIVVDHWATLYDFRTDKLDRGDLFAFYILPLLLAGILIGAGMRLDGPEVTVLITALSIFAALLFNLLLLTHSIVTQTESELHEGRRKLLREIYAHISYAVLISVIAIVFLLASVVLPSGSPWVDFTLSGAVYFLVLNFLGTLFLILNRIHVMLAAEFSNL
jgi:hypothetical protein